MKKILFLCAACLLALAGCTRSPGESAAPTASATTAPTATPLAVETPVAPTPILEPTVTPVETHPPVTETLPPETEAPQPDGWDGNPDALTLNDFPTQLTSGPEVADALNALPAERFALFLISQLPDYDTWLYGAYGPDMEGLILRVGTVWKYFEVAHLSPQSNMPAMAYGDFDGDLEMELAVLPYQAGGTGVNVWGLYVVEFGPDGAWSVLEFAPSDYQAILDQSVACSYQTETNTATLTAGDSVMDVALADLGYPAPGEPVEAYTGHIVYFTVESDAISGHFMVGLSAPGVTPGMLPSVALLNADVVYTGSAFGLNAPALAEPEF